YRMLGRDRVEILPAGKFLHRPQRVVPSGSDDPFSRPKISEARTNSLVQLLDGLRPPQVHFQLHVRARRQMSMSVIETGHRELAVQIDHASVRTKPGFYLCIALGPRACYRGNEFSANRHSAGPRLSREARVDFPV